MNPEATEAEGPVPQPSPRRKFEGMFDSTASKPSEGWMLTYMDTLTLLITFFVMILSFASFDKDKFEEFKHGMSFATNGTGIMPDFLGIQKSKSGEYVTATPLIIPPEPVQLVPVALPEGAEALQQYQPENDTLARLQRHIGEIGLGDDILLRHRQGIVEVEIKAKVLFPLGRAELTESGIAILTHLSKLLESYTGTIVVEGHTDNLPIRTAQFPSNWELSGARASSVARHFIAKGIRSRRVKIVGYADTRPLLPNITPEQRQQNRRVNIVLEMPAEASATQ